MTLVFIVIGALVGLVVLFLGLQIFMISRMRQQKGKPAPELAGKLGRWVGTGKQALFYFYSPGCGACRQMTPVVKKLADERDGGVYPVDISLDLETARKFGVMATPTTIVVGEGVIQQVLVGPQQATAIHDLV